MKIRSTIAASAIVLAAMACMSSVASAATSFYKFYEGGTGYASAYSGTGTVYTLTKGLTTLCPTGHSGCGGADVLSTPLTFGSASLAGGVVTATATAHLPGASGQQVWDDLSPNYGGLGVDSLGLGDDDNISGAEVLKLSFANQVDLTGIATLFDPAHTDFGTGFATAADVIAHASTIDFQISVDGGAWTDVSLLSANNDALNLIGTNFSFREDTASSNPSFYVSAVAVATAVPEPATWAMFLVGFGGIGFMLRGRRKGAAATA